MTIPFSRYIDITSGVGAGVNIPGRALVGRLFTDNNLIPPGEYIELTSATAVGSYFGISSNEYLRSVFYFGWVSKNITRAQKIQFARFVSVDVAPRLYGLPVSTLATYTAINNASFGVTIGVDVNTFAGVNFTGAVSYAAVAAILQVAIRSAVGVMWTAATVVYNATRGSFDIVGGATTALAISIQQGVGGTPASVLLGWLPAATFVQGAYVVGAITATGALAQEPVAAVTASADASNNFGSFLFMDTITLSQIQAVAAWNLTENVSYLYTVAVSAANASAWSVGLIATGGIALTLSPTAGQYPEMVPMMIEAATDYTLANSVQNYMFQQFVLTASVTTNALANTYDTLRVNYYGRTQDAGTFIDFYQRGFMMGGATDPLDMNAYANEQWLKDAAGSAVMTLLLTLSRISANAKGRSQILSTLQSVINEALNNGTISIGKTLSNSQKIYITEQTGDPDAWYQIQNIGYWVDCAIVSFNSPVEYKAVYTLMYSKDDVIRKVDGTHVLI